MTTESVFLDLEVGAVIAERTVTLTRDSLVRYAGASGDFNPIHYRDDFAATVGLPGVIAHGMLTMGQAIQPVADWAGDPARIIDYQVRFTRPVVVDPRSGAELKIVAKVGVYDAEAGTVRIDISAQFNDQTVLGKAQATVSVA